MFLLKLMDFVFKNDELWKELCKFPGLILVEYADGFRGGVLMLNGYRSKMTLSYRV